MLDEGHVKNCGSISPLRSLVATPDSLLQVVLPSDAAWKDGLPTAIYTQDLLLI